MSSDTTRSEHHADSPAPTVRESRRRVRATLERHAVGRDNAIHGSDLADLVAELREWSGHFDAPIPDGTAARLATATRFCYVGSHAQSVYERVMQHAEGEQSSTVMAVWPPVEIDAILRSDTPKGMEYSFALDRAARDGTVVWQDGSLV